MNVTKIHTTGVDGKRKEHDEDEDEDTITRLVFTHFLPKHVTVKTDNHSEMADPVTECPLYHFIRLGR